MDDALMLCRATARTPLRFSLFPGNRRAATLSALALALAALAAGPASAQTLFFGWGPSPDYGYRPPAPIYRPIAPRYIPAPASPDDEFESPRARRLTGAEVSRMLRARGMEVSAAPIRNGGVYVADVVDRAGRPRRLIVDGYYGRVLQTFPGAGFGDAPRAPGPRLAGRPPQPDVDTDAFQPGAPSVIPGVGPGAGEPRPQKPKARQAQPKKPVKSAAKPPAAAPAAAPAPAAVEPAPIQAAPLNSPPVQSPRPGLNAPADPAPAQQQAPAPAASVAPVEPQAPTPPPTSVPAAEPPAGEAAAPASESPDRPRRRVRFIKPDSPTVADPNVPGGQLVPIPEPPPVDLTPRSAEAPATGQQ